MFSVGTREIALSRRNAVHNGPAEHNQTLNIEGGLCASLNMNEAAPLSCGRRRGVSLAHIQVPERALRLCPARSRFHECESAALCALVLPAGEASPSRARQP